MMGFKIRFAGVKIEQLSNRKQKEMVYYYSTFKKRTDLTYAIKKKLIK
jgi:hypothetical protein